MMQRIVSRQRALLLPCRRANNLLIRTSIVRNVSSSSAAIPVPVAKDMSCFQCEQTRDGKGCRTVGVCGKDADVAALQDLAVSACLEASSAIHKAGSPDSSVDDTVAIINTMFTTLTNVNFDAKRIHEEIEIQRRIIAKYNKSSSFLKSLPDSKASLADFIHAAKPWGVDAAIANLGADAGGVREMVVYGLKGTGAYMHHAIQLGNKDPSILKEFNRIMSIVAPREPNSGAADLGGLLAAALNTGNLNTRVMASLEKEHIGAYGTPSPTVVNTGHKKGKAILVSGHDLHDLASLLDAVKGTDINVYTHGEMLPAHGYPKLRASPNLAGHYGTAWQNQKFEFASFPGSVLLTSNCLMPPMKTYKNRLFTTEAVGYDGVKHLGNKDWKPLIDAAKAESGFKEDLKGAGLTVGVGADYIISNAPAVLDAVKGGSIKKFFVIGGCDGAEKERSYFKDLALASGDESLILTLGCGKFRFNRDLEGQKVGAFPKVLDVGQCNDAYGAVRVALALTGALGAKHPNDLPIYYGISWFEQKAVAVLLSMLDLGIKNIHLGPALPAFITPNVLNVLVDKFAIAPTMNAKKDFNI